MIGRSQLKGKKGSFFLVISLIGNLGLLFAFKYFDFFAGLVNALFSKYHIDYTIPFLDVILPVGISFYTFQTLSYTIDVWRGKIKPNYSFFDFALFVSFFPQLVAGPIVRARNFLGKLNNKKKHFSLNGNVVSIAFFLILTGLIKKIGADWLAVNIVDRVFNEPSMFSSLETLTAVYAYALQIYGDFSGYTDIALGSAMLLGFKLTKNFDRPYLAISISDFWRRWHISLGSWFRDYLYIGLGGNRRHVYFNLLFTMFVCGMWHGVGFKFIIWGLYHGFFC